LRTFLMFLTLLSFTAVAAEVDQNAAAQTLKKNETVLIDVRSAAEFAREALPGAKHVELGQVAKEISEVAPNKDTPVVVYCRSNRCSSIAQDTLRSLGYRKVVNAGGYEQFKSVLDTVEAE